MPSRVRDPKSGLWTNQSIRPDPDDDATHPAAVMMNGTPAGGMGTHEDVAHAAVYLASDEAGFVHGAVIDVDGGRIGAAVIAK
jgi:NAD(P)-dependent dehydrogenase (short-subunit alcohol dehydrogenase family)